MLSLPRFFQEIVFIIIFGTYTYDVYCPKIKYLTKKLHTRPTLPSKPAPRGMPTATSFWSALPPKSPDATEQPRYESSSVGGPSLLLTTSGRLYRFCDTICPVKPTTVNYQFPKPMNLKTKYILVILYQYFAVEWSGNMKQSIVGLPVLVYPCHLQ